MRPQTGSLLARLQGVKERNGGTRWRALCPAHDDHNASLDIEEGRELVLLRCRSHGCDPAAICRALGLEVSQLTWKDRRASLQTTTLPLSPRRAIAEQTPGAQRRRNLVGVSTQPAPDPGEDGDRLVATHVYGKADGTPVLQVRRYHRRDPTRVKGYKKACIVYHREGELWVPGLAADTPRVLYNLENIVINPGARVVWVEGENKVDALLDVGILATTALGGTGGKSVLPDLSILAGREVCILPDADEPGREYAEVIRLALKTAGAVPYIQPDLPEVREQDRHVGFDVADYLELSGGNVDDLLPLLEAPPPERLRFPLLTVKELLALPPPEWMVRDFIQEQCLFLFFGEPGDGKSFLAMDLLLNLAVKAGEWCGREVKVSGPTVFINADGGRGFRDRVDAWFTANEQDRDTTPFYTLNTHLPLGEPGCIGEFMRSLDLLPEPPAAILVDTYSRCNAGRDENNQGESSLVVQHMDLLRERTGCSVGAIHHTDASGKGPRGSSVLIGAVDSAWRVTKQGKDISVTCSKQRNGDDTVPGLRFTLEPVGGTGQVVLWHAGQADAQLEKAKAEIDILKLFQDEPDLTAKQIQDATGYSQQRISEILRDLGKQEIITRCGQRIPNGGGTPAKLFRLKNPDR